MVGIVVTSADRDAYEAAARAGGAGSIVFTLDRPEDIDGVLTSLDEELWAI